MKLLFYIFLLYLAYQVIFKFVIPVYKTTKQMKQKMSEMQQKMEERQQQYNRQEPGKTSAPKASVGGDYIDYEEVK